MSFQVGKIPVYERVELPEDVHKAVVSLVAKHGYGGAMRRLCVGSSTFDELRWPTALVIPKTLAKVRAKLVQLGELAG